METVWPSADLEHIGLTDRVSGQQAITYNKKILGVLLSDIRLKPIASFPDVLINESSARGKTGDIVSTPYIDTPKVPCSSCSYGLLLCSLFGPTRIRFYNVPRSCYEPAETMRSCGRRHVVPSLREKEMLDSLMLNSIQWPRFLFAFHLSSDNDNAKESTRNKSFTTLAGG